MSPEFSQQEQTPLENFLASREIISLETARFLDRLEPEYEQAWEELLQLGYATESTVEDLMTPVWKDNSIPQAFRDRAMLSVVGTTETRKALGQSNRRKNGDFAFNGVSVTTYLIVVSSFDAEQFRDWLQEAWEYQNETGALIIDNLSYLTWQYELYERGFVTDEELDSFVVKIDIAGSSPQWYESDSICGDMYRLDENRFPLLSDILHDRTASPGDERVRSWALKHLESWLDHITNPEVELPGWLADVPQETGSKLFKEIINGGDKPDWLSWELVHAAINTFGLEGIFSDEFSSGFYLYDVHRVQDQSLKENLLKAILIVQRDKAASGGYIALSRITYSSGNSQKPNSVRGADIMQSVIDATADP